MHLVLLEENILLDNVPDISEWFRENVKNEWVIINGNHGGTLNYDVFQNGTDDHAMRNKQCFAIFGFVNIDEALMFKLRWVGNTKEAD